MPLRKGYFPKGDIYLTLKGDTTSHKTKTEESSTLPDPRYPCEAPSHRHTQDNLPRG